MNRILVLNPKGGSGKTTIATNLASYYACQGVGTALLDYDPQGSSARWASQRHEDLPPVHCVNACAKTNTAMTRSWYLRVPPGTEQMIIDAPAGVTGAKLQEFLRNVDAILIPVMPSSIDVHAMAKFIQELLLQGKVKQRGIKVGIVANRVKAKTNAYRALMQFLSTLKLPFITSIRDSQYYVAAADMGIGVHEISGKMLENDKEQWHKLYEWLQDSEQNYESDSDFLQTGHLSYHQHT